eukprot:155185_1
MASTEYHKNIIYEQIDTAISINELMPILQFMELETIKNVMKSQLETIVSNEISNIFYKSLSIENILPLDIIQHITSFNNLRNIKSVSKTFNKCYEKNKNIKSQQIEKEFLCKMNMNKNENNNTWIVDKNRTKLNEKEIKSKYKGPINNLSDAINNTNSGDKILVYNGKYSSSCS